MPKGNQARAAYASGQQPSAGSTCLGATKRGQHMPRGNNQARAAHVLGKPSAGSICLGAATNLVLTHGLNRPHSTKHMPQGMHALLATERVEQMHMTLKSAPVHPRGREPSAPANQQAATAGARVCAVCVRVCMRARCVCAYVL